MKLLLPVGGIAIGTFICCCGGDMSEIMEEIEAAQGGSSAGADAWEEPAGDEAAAPTLGGMGGSTDGLCGRFKTDGLSLPSGYSVIGCTTTPGSESLLAMGGTPPKELCASVKGWATGAGWAVESEVDMQGTVAMTLKNGGSRMSLSCSDSTGQTSLAASITPG